MRYLAGMPGLIPHCDNDSTSNRLAFRLRLAALLLWALALLIFSLLPGVTAPHRMFSWDKFNHFAAYAVLAVLFGRLLSAWPGARAKVWLLAGSGAFGFGLLLEVLQGVMHAGRSAEWGDLLANGLGVLTACVVFCRIHRRHSTR